MTQALAGALVGTGVSEGYRRVRWRVAGRLVLARVVPLPAAVFVAALEGQLEATTDAARLILDAVSGSAQHRQDAAEALAEVEARGDAWRGRLVEALGGALTTPIDREDLFRVSRSVDDVLDNLRDFARELTLYQPSSGEPFVPVLETLVEGLPALCRAVEDLLATPNKAVRPSHVAKQGANALRERYEEQVAALFSQELSMEALKRRELLRRLDVVGLRFSEAADALADGALKRGH